MCSATARTQTVGSWPDSLVVKNASETPAPGLGVHAAAGVGERKTNVGSGGGVRDSSDVRGADFGDEGLNDEGSTLGHGVAGVGGEFQDRLFDQAWIGGDRGEGGGRAEFECHLVPE